MDTIILINKPRGITPLDSITLLKRSRPDLATQTISFAGRLDPMAEGLLVLLVGDENKKRKEYEGLTKTYEFTLLLGITTDTYDLLGKITSITTPSSTSEKKLLATLPSLVRIFSQPYPPYSSKPVDGKPLYYWARENKLAEITIPEKTVTISSLTPLTSSRIETARLVSTLSSELLEIKGDFRQKEILTMWNDSIPLLPSELPLFSFQVECSSGTYIRSLCHDLGKRSGCGGLAYRIKRTRVGAYQLKDALTL